MEGAGRRFRDNIALIGFMGAGKSAVGRLLAPRLKMEFIDLDEIIAAQAGMSISEIFDVEGESGFRNRESAALRASLQGEGKMLSCGGGIVIDDENIHLLRSGCRVFFLRISTGKAAERLSGGGGRPLIAGGDLEDKVRVLMDERKQRYLEAADEVVEADDASPQELAEEIAARWWRYRSGHPEGIIPPS
jgi:shikimate kinase